MIPDHRIFITHIVYLCLCILSPNCASSSCPMDFSYVQTLPWDSSSCHDASSSSSSCCQTLTSLHGVGTAKYLNQTSLFRLPDLQTSISCLSEFQTKLSLLNLHENLTSLCFNPQRFVNTTNVCADVQTQNDWISILGESTSLDRDCRKDMKELSACDACVLAGFKVQSQLLAADGNKSHSKGCFQYTILYAAGIVNELGPESEGVLSCIFGLPLIVSSQTGARNWALIFGTIGGGLAALGVTCLVGFWMRGSAEVSARSFRVSDDDDDSQGVGLLNWRPKADSLWYDIEDLELATDMFSSKNLIGTGQFSVVYKGKLADGSSIAVKKVMDTDLQGDAEFSREVEIISTLKHRNLVPIRGCCVSENQKFLVDDYMPNGNLSDRLFPVMKMSWPQRKSIILDVANALAYLHQGVNPPVYHRDIKPTNILLDSCMRARVGDFGLVKQGIGEGQSHITMRIVGTHGYLAPEYALYGQLTGKSDVYSFGIVVLEMMSGRRALDLTSSTCLITDWAWLLVKEGKTEQVLDPWLLGYEDPVMKTRYPRMIMERFVMVGILCAHLMVALRPTIVDALKMLDGDIEVPTIPDRPFYAHVQKA